jgi:hypothetical protein
MAGPTDDNEHTPPHSPRTKGILQALVCEVKKHTEGIDVDVQVTSERIGVLEATQLATDTKRDNGGFRCSYRQQPCCSVEAF